MKARNRPIQSKISRAILATSTIVLVLTGISYTIYEFVTYRENTVERMTVLSEVLSNASTAALAFDSKEEAYEILSALRAQEHIIAAALYDEKDRLFTNFPEELLQGQVPESLPEDGFYFEGYFLDGFQPVMLGENRIGTIYMRYNLQMLNNQFQYFAVVAFLVFCLSLLLAYILSASLQKRISAPIIALADMTKIISERKDYSVRAQKQSEDEIGVLTDAFNQMLAQIEEQSLALRKSELFSRSLLESSPDCVNALNLQGGVLTMNSQGKRMFEIEDFELNQNWVDMWAADYRQEVLKALEQAKNGYVGHFQVLSPTAKGISKWWDVLVAPVYGTDMRVERLIAVSRDVSKLKELEQQKDEFIGIASHELKTPVTSIKAYVQILQSRIKEEEDMLSAQMLGRMNSQLNRLTLLITDLLDVTRIEQGRLQFRKEYFCFNKMVRDVADDIQKTTGSHKLTLQLSEDVSVWGDSDRLGQVLTNFLTNAIKYSPKAREVVVRTTVINSKEVILAVQDFGLGLSAEDREKVFERFYRVGETGHETYPGLGLGLYICAGIIQRHNGKVWVESEKGKGSTFYFSLPLEVL